MRYTRLGKLFEGLGVVVALTVLAAGLWLILRLIYAPRGWAALANPQSGLGGSVNFDRYANQPEFGIAGCISLVYLIFVVRTMARIAREPVTVPAPETSGWEAVIHVVGLLLVAPAIMIVGMQLSWLIHQR